MFEKERAARKIVRWINNADDNQVKNCIIYLNKRIVRPLYTNPNIKKDIADLFFENPSSEQKTCTEKSWEAFEKMRTHCRQIKHRSKSQKSQLSASIHNKSKLKLEKMADETGQSQSEILELAIKITYEMSDKQKIKRKLRNIGSIQNTNPIFQEQKNHLDEHYRFLSAKHYSLILKINELIKVLEEIHNETPLANHIKYKLQPIIDELKEQAPLI